jgi:hypothetical protein
LALETFVSLLEDAQHAFSFICAAEKIIGFSAVLSPAKSARVSPRTVRKPSPSCQLDERLGDVRHVPSIQLPGE